MDNYQMLIEKWQQIFLSLDYKNIYKRLSLDGWDEENPRITYYGVTYEFDLSTGALFNVDDPRKNLEFDTRMAIYNLFYYAKEHPFLSGKWVPFRDVRRAAPFTDAFHRSVLVPFAKAFDGRMDALLQAGERLGFRRIPFSDAGFEAMAFSCLPIRFLFWDGDDEFAAQTNILFDCNITDYVHEETVVSLANDGVRLLIETADKLGSAG